MALLSGRPLFFAITTLTCFSFLLIGYDNGVYGGLVNQPAFNRSFNTPGATILGFLVSLYEIGCFVGSISTAVFGERLGRRRSMCFGGIIMIVGALLQSTAYSRPHLIVGRIVSGFGMGMINSSAPVYQAEFSPKASRGLYACAQLSTLNLGIALSYWIDYGFRGQISSYAWRVPVILQCVFVMPIIGLSLMLPETPRWLIAHNRHSEATAVYSRLHAHQLSAAEISAQLEIIRRTIQIEDSAQQRSWRTFLRKDDIGSRRRLLIACLIQGFQQLGGINGIIFFSGTIFSQSLGFSSNLSALMSGFLNTWFFVASFIPWLLIDRVGRRPLFLSMISLMAAVFAVQAALVRQIQYKTSIAHASGIGAATMLFVYYTAFTIGFQATVWVYPPEILPLRLRQTGTALAASCNWIINFVVVTVTPPGLSNIGWRYYIIYAVFNACFVPVIYFFFPETKGLALEDVDYLFATQEVKENIDSIHGAVHGVRRVGSQEESEDLTTTPLKV